MSVLPAMFVMSSYFSHVERHVICILQQVVLYWKLAVHVFGFSEYRIYIPKRRGVEVVLYWYSFG